MECYNINTCSYDETGMVLNAAIVVKLIIIVTDLKYFLNVVTHNNYYIIHKNFKGLLFLKAILYTALVS